MVSKLSKVQKEVLTHMAEGHKLCVPSRGNTPWLSGVPGKHGLDKRVHSNTLYALIDRGYIKKATTEATPWWRGDYVITQEGREVIQRTCGNCKWQLPDNPVNRSLYPGVVGWPICGRRGTVRTLLHVEETHPGCDKHVGLWQDKPPCQVEQSRKEEAW